MTHVVTLNQQNFAETIFQGEGIALVDFWAERCEHCLALAPVIDRLAENYSGRVLVGKLDVDSNPDICRQCKVLGLPTVIIYRNGQVQDQLMCSRSYEEYAEKLDELLKM